MRLSILAMSLTFGCSLAIASPPDNGQPLLLSAAQLDSVDAGRRNRNRHRNRATSDSGSATTTQGSLSIATGNSNVVGYGRLYAESITRTTGRTLITGNFAYTSGSSYSRSIGCSGC